MKYVEWNPKYLCFLFLGIRFDEIQYKFILIQKKKQQNRNHCWYAWKYNFLSFLAQSSAAPLILRRILEAITCTYITSVWKYLPVLVWKREWTKKKNQQQKGKPSIFVLKQKCFDILKRSQNEKMISCIQHKIIHEAHTHATLTYTHIQPFMSKIKIFANELIKTNCFKTSCRQSKSKKKNKNKINKTHQTPIISHWGK